MSQNDSPQSHNISGKPGSMPRKYPATVNPNRTTTNSGSVSERRQP